MTSDRPITPYAPFVDPPRSITPPSMSAVSEPPSTRPSTFTSAIRDELALIEQSLIANVSRTLQQLGTLVIERVHESRKKHESRLDAHRVELQTIRGALERGGTILPPPPDGL